jgi:glycosyltransferase involved in cell wall biosynthesis
LALLEAMSYNRMAVVTDVGDARELIDDGINGFIADAPTVKHIDEALERAWEKRNDWEEMGKLAGQRLLATKPADPIQTLVDKLLDLIPT